VLRFDFNVGENNYSTLLKDNSAIDQEIKDLQASQPDLEKIFRQIIK
jgi:hypothetical protein